MRPSLRGGALAAAWVGAFIAVILTGVDLPLPVRIGICVCAATASVSTIQSVFILGGPRAVRALSWAENGSMQAFIGARWRELTVIVAPGSCRLSPGWLLLRLESCDGTFGFCIDGAAQDSRAFRRLCRHLENGRNTFPDEGPASS